MFLVATIFTRIWRLGNQHYSVRRRLSDFSVKISGSVVLNKLRQGRLVKLSQHVLKLGQPPPPAANVVPYIFRNVPTRVLLCFRLNFRLNSPFLSR
jgi:hypothetical protein